MLATDIISCSTRQQFRLECLADPLFKCSSRFYQMRLYAERIRLKKPRYRHPFIPGLIRETLTCWRELGKDAKSLWRPKTPPKSSLSITWAGSTVNSWHDALLPFALSHWASHPSVSVFVLSWQQQYDRSWVGVRDELWGKRPGFYKEDGGRARARNKEERLDTEEEREYLSPPLSLSLSAPGHDAIVLFSWPQISQAIYLCRREPVL